MSWSFPSLTTRGKTRQKTPGAGLSNHDVVLEETDLLRFAHAVETSFAVATRSQFFVWAQGGLQSVVPHEILLCAVREGARQGMRWEQFTASRYFRQAQFDAVTHAVHGLLPHLLRAVELQSGEVVFSPQVGGAAGSHEIDALVAAHEMNNLAALRVRGIDGGTEALYAFARVGAAFGPLLRRRLELAAPHLHATFLRLLAHERDDAGPLEVRPDIVITRRQVEILRLIKDGKTNAEIASVLDCSQWTIKNHIQNILRRLNTNSRAHALVVAMRMGILRPD